MLLPFYTGMNIISPIPRRKIRQSLLLPNSVTALRDQLIWLGLDSIQSLEICLKVFKFLDHRKVVFFILHMGINFYYILIK